jgi:hypothetical protein
MMERHTRHHLSLRVFVMERCAPGGCAGEYSATGKAGPDSSELENRMLYQGFTPVASRRM